MRLDLLLCRLRLCKTRSLAKALVEQGHIRINGERVTAASRDIAIGDVLTMPRSKAVLVAEVLALPERRGPPAEAQSCYRVLDPTGESAIAGQQGYEFKGNRSP